MPSSTQAGQPHFSLLLSSLLTISCSLLFLVLEKNGAMGNLSRSESVYSGLNICVFTPQNSSTEVLVPRVMVLWEALESDWVR